MNKSIKSNDLDALDAAFAEKVAGWYLSRNGESLDYVCYRSEVDYFAQPLSATWPLPKFTRSANDALPWLEHWCPNGSDTRDILISRRISGDWVVELRVRKEPFGEWSSWGVGYGAFPHAAVIALLRAHGVEVIDDE